MAVVQYNNNIFSFRGKISRTSYILQNFIINLLGFRFIYYPAIVEAYRIMLSQPETKEIISALYQNSFYASIFDHLANAEPEPMLFVVIKFLFLIPLRLIDIKRIRDIVNDELSLMRTAIFAVVLSIPTVDLLGTIVLAILPPNRFAKNNLEKEIQQNDLSEANAEHDLVMYKRLFEEGKISKADYLKVLEQNRKNR